MNKAEQFAQKINQKRIRAEIEQLIGSKIEEIAKIIEDEKHISEIRRLDSELSALYSKLDEVSELAKIQPKKGDKGEKGERGEDGITKIIKEITEKNITAEEVRDLLESLTGNARLDAKAIKNLPKPIQQYIAGGSGGGGTLNHAELTNLAWSVAGHTIDTNIDLNNNALTNVDHLIFTTLHTSNGEPVGSVYWNADEDTLDVKVSDNVTLQTGQEMLFTALNQTGADIPDGTFVMFAGTVGNSGKFLIQKGIADGSLAPEYTMGLTTEAIANGADGKVTWFGKVRGINTTGTPYGETWNDGDLIYASPTVAGALTNIAPDNGFRNIIVAAVVHAHTNGTLFVRPTWRPKLEELDGVEITSIQNRQAIQYDSASGLYKNSSELPNHIDSTSNPHDTSDANILISDITTNNATTSAHGFLPKLSGNAVQYLNGQGNYSTITGANTPVGYNETTFSGQTSVNVVHNFGVKPLVQVLDDSGSPLVELPLSIVHNTDNDFTVNFSTAQSGSIIASAGNAFPNITTVNTNYTITNNDNIIVVNAIDIIITLPTAVGITGKTFSIDNASGGYIIVDTTGSETIWGEVSQRIPKNSTIVVYSTGNNWRIT